MRVKLIVQLSGTRDGAEWPARGETVDLPDDEAVSLLGAGIAVPLGEAPVESAAADTRPKGR